MSMTLNQRFCTDIIATYLCHAKQYLFIMIILLEDCLYLENVHIHFKAEIFNPNRDVV